MIVSYIFGMGQIKKILQYDFNFIHKRKWQWGVAFLMSLSLFLVTYFTADIMFSTNDDMRIMYALAGYNTGEPYPYHPFINFFLGKIISLEYLAAPGIPWYAIFHVLCLFIGNLVTGKCLIKISAAFNGGLFMPILIHVFLFYSVIIFSVVSMQFSTTPAVLGCASISLVYSMEIGKEHKKYIIADLLLSIVLLLICYMTRSFTWYCVMCFYALAVFYQILTLLKRGRKFACRWIVVLIGCILVSGIAVFALREVSLSLKAAVEENSDFEEYNDYRTDFQDYRMRVDYYSNPEFYEEIGWSKNTYRAALSLLFFDKGMNTENFKAITEAYRSDAGSRGIKDTYDTAISIFDSYRVAKSGMAVLAVLFILCMCFSFKKKESWREKLCAFFAAAGYFLMFLFLSYRGRLPIRTFMVITICADSFLGLSIIKIVNIKELHKKRLVSAIGLISMLLIALYNIRAVYLTDDCTKTQTQTTATAEQILEFESYAIANPDNVYVYDFTVATMQRNPFVVYPDAKPLNCIVSGGSYTFSTIYYKQLEKNGLKSLYWTDFLKDNIYYATSDFAYIELMTANIEEKSGQTVLYKEIKEFGDDGVKIYQFFTEDYQ